MVVEVQPGVYRKNAQIAHIRGVRAPQHDPSLTPRPLHRPALRMQASSAMAGHLAFAPCDQDGCILGRPAEILAITTGKRQDNTALALSSTDGVAPDA